MGIIGVYVTEPTSTHAQGLDGEMMKWRENRIYQIIRQWKRSGLALRPFWTCLELCLGKTLELGRWLDQERLRYSRNRWKIDLIRDTEQQWSVECRSGEMWRDVERGRNFKSSSPFNHNPHRKKMTRPNPGKLLEPLKNDTVAGHNAVTMTLQCHYNVTLRCRVYSPRIPQHPPPLSPQDYLSYCWGEFSCKEQLTATNSKESPTSCQSYDKVEICWVTTPPVHLASYFYHSPKNRGSGTSKSVGLRLERYLLSTNHIFWLSHTHLYIKTRCHLAPRVYLWTRGNECAQQYIHQIHHIINPAYEFVRMMNWSGYYLTNTLIPQSQLRISSLFLTSDSSILFTPLHSNQQQQPTHPYSSHNVLNRGRRVREISNLAFRTLACCNWIWQGICTHRNFTSRYARSNIG